jgi:PiT family inorganic phosphate transporter
MLDANALLYSVLALILAAEFVNGWTDSPNAIATVVSTRVLSPYQAVIMATVLNALGAMSGTAVAATVGKDIVRPEVINLMTVAAAMAGIIFWSTLAWYWGLPMSTTHTINTAIVGVGATRRFSAVRWGVTFEIVTAWILTFPVCGLIGWGTTKLLLMLTAAWP